MTFRKLWIQWKDQLLPGAREEGQMNRQSTEDFQGSEKVGMIL